MATQHADRVKPPILERLITKIAISTTASGVIDMGEYRGFVVVSATVGFGIVHGVSAAELAAAPLLAATDASNPTQRCRAIAADLPIHYEVNESSRYFRVVGAGAGTFEMWKA